MAYPSASSTPPPGGDSYGGDDGDGLDDDGPGGDDPFDWDEPLDLPPGVFVMPSDPVAVPA